MLVLSRQRDETVIMDFTKCTDDDFKKLRAGELIEVMVMDIRGDKVRLGFGANKGVIVHRKEVWDAIQKENCQVNKVSNEKVADTTEQSP